MVKKITFLLFICLFINYCNPAIGQLQQNILFKQLKAQDGLGSSVVTCVFQDNKDFLWLGTDRGLVRYDGKFFKQYNQIGEGGITNKNITCINEDAAGNIWFGTENGLNKLDLYSNKITQFYEGDGEGKIPFKWCNYLFVDNQKQLWLTTEKGIAFYNSKENSFINYSVSVVGKDEKINKFINQVVADSNGDFWLSTSFGVKKFNPVTKKYTSYHKEEKGAYVEQENVLYGVHIDETGVLWGISFSGILLRYNTALNKMETVFDANNKEIRFHSIASYNKQGKLYLLIAASNGLWQLDPSDLQNSIVKFLQPTSLTKVFIDKQQNIWLASNVGLYKHSYLSNALQWHNLPSNDKLFIFHIIPKINTNHQYFLTTTSNWYKYDDAKKSISSYILPVDKRELLTKINRYVVDENGYWFTSVNGFGYYNVKENKLTDLTYLLLKKSNQYSTGYIEEPIKNQLWITLRRSGILLYDKITRKDTLLFGNKEQPDNIFGKDIYDLKLSPDGFVWFTTSEKIYKVHPTTYAYKTYTIDGNKISTYRLLFTSNGKLLVNNESNIYEFSDEKMVLLHPSKGVFNFSLSRLVEDEKNTIWAITDDGLYKTNTNFSYWKSMKSIQELEDESPGFEINLSIPETVILTSKGRIGLINYKNLEQTKLPSPSLIARIRLGQKELFFPNANIINNCGFKDAIEIELTAPDFGNENDNVIFYKLEGWDNEWKRLMNSNIVRYEQLPAGNYIFSTKVKNSDGKESIIATSQFKIVPPFYRTWWFLLLTVIIVATIAFLFYRYKIKKAVELEKIRTKIATDLHDDIGATLSSISMYSDAIGKEVKEKIPHLEPVLNKVGENSREMVASISDIVWAVNPENDSGEKLLQRMETYATDICAVKNIQLHFLADKKIKQLPILPDKRKNIYLVFKEAINNAVKYSGAKNMWVSITANDFINLIIKDDGIGFDTTLVKNGNGLKNFVKRADEVKGKVNIESIIDKGTSISLICNV